MEKWRAEQVGERERRNEGGTCVCKEVGKDEREGELYCLVDVSAHSAHWPEFFLSPRNTFFFIFFKTNLYSGIQARGQDRSVTTSHYKLETRVKVIVRVRSRGKAGRIVA